MSISANQLKVMLRLLGCPNYRSLLSELRLGQKIAPPERARLCRELQTQGWLDFEEAIDQFAIAAPGRVLLKLDSRSLPVTPDERLILEACQERLQNFQSLPPQVPEADRLRLVLNLVERGLLKVKKFQIREVWLTESGIRYLRDECEPTGTSPWLSSDLLSLYLKFLRGVLEPKVEESFLSPTWNEQDVLKLIQDLDRELNTDNYLPLFYLREKVQPPLSRDQLDQMLYDLQRSDRLELVSVQEVSAYTPQQLKAAIPQNTGSPLFFVSVL